MVRLLVSQHPQAKHSEICTGVSWSGANELVSVADDKKVWSWNVEGEPQALLLETDTYCTEIRWFPSLHGGKGSEIFVVGCTDGSFKLVGKSGRIEKVVNGAHNGAVTTLRWSNDGQSLATSGEDGQVKSWSRNGMFRAHLAQAEGAVYTLCWSAESEQILFSSGKHLVRTHIINAHVPSLSRSLLLTRPPLLLSFFSSTGDPPADAVVQADDVEGARRARPLGRVEHRQQPHRLRRRGLQVPRMGLLRPAALLVVRE